MGVLFDAPPLSGACPKRQVFKKSAKMRLFHARKTTTYRHFSKSVFLKTAILNDLRQKGHFWAHLSCGVLIQSCNRLLGCLSEGLLFFDPGEARNDPEVMG